MDIQTQLIIRNNPNLYRYLREHSYWYKYLNRDPSTLKQMEEEMKNKYKLRPQDKIENFSRSIQMLSSFLEVMK